MPADIRNVLMISGFIVGVCLLALSATRSPLVASIASPQKAMSVPALVPAACQGACPALLEARN